MMTANSEMEKENPPLWGMGVVAAAVVVHLMHSMAQKELSAMVTDMYSNAIPSILTLILACLQVAAAVNVLRVNGLNFSTSNTSREAAVTGLLGYVGGLFLLNYLLWGGNSAASACFGVQEPVLCMLLLCAAASIPTDLHRVAAVVCLCVGAGLLTADFTLLVDGRALLRILASLFVLVRNVVTKHLYDNSVTFIPRSQNTLLTTAACWAMLAVVVSLMVSSGLLMASLLAVLTGVLSVTLVHLEFTLLTMYDTLTVAVFMLWAQVLENVIILTDVPRPGVIGVVVGAAMFAAGHYTYFKDGLESGTIHLNLKRVGVNELLTRLQFLMYAGSIVGLTATLLQPTISERDIRVLSYVGLDRIARRLLNVHPSEH
ncbi:uncharacterized protein LOC143279353 isoform X2 [Babylonia areolata]